ncbi:hypothetical protein Vadar_025419 [Vaccinium darrowii]|uniref:Uncharacterized protein n=1 Tax=Vaccinium darrowii TaxID=229202 RepID=A0ACB7YQ09_9ERIC|nr:hypothetical protein Vadar_025419 [Vaccinium darrowii]
MSPAPRQVTILEALRYLKKLKNTLRPEEYNTFMTLVTGTREESTHTGFVVAKMVELFECNRELVTEFNCFLPEVYEITSDTYYGGCYNWISAVKGSVDFLNKIRTIMEDEDDCTYKAFLDIMVKYGKEHGDVDEVYREGIALFEKEPCLFVEFTRFFTD